MPISSPRSLHIPGLMTLAMLVAGCSHAPRQEMPLTPANLAQAAAAPASAPDGARKAATEIQSQGVEPPRTSVQTLPANPEPDSYAYRDDAHRLAVQLAEQQGLDAGWAWNALQRAKYKESVTRFIMPAPAGTAKNWTAYRARFVEPIRIRAGVQFWRDQRDTLLRAEREYGVPASVIVGVLGVETIYGRQMGSFRALDALATLSLDFPRGRSDRSEFFKTELGQLLKWCQQTGTEPDTVMASYAGAIGMPQFMPSSILRYAVDFDGDGRIDLLRSSADAIGSVAHYLASQGWVSGLPGYYDVQPPAQAEALRELLGPDIVPTFTAQQMIDAGASLPVLAQVPDQKLALVALQNGDAPPVYVAGTANFYAVTRYNQSSYYALAVLQLGEAVQREAERLTTSMK